MPIETKNHPIARGVRAKLEKTGPRKLLALDGGGIRGLISVELLAKIESTLRSREGRPGLVLADYFDYVAGTSTGAIVAACVTLGMTVDEIRTFYLSSGAEMFEPARLLARLRTRYKDDALSRKLMEVFDHGMPKGPDGAQRHRTLGDDALKTLFMAVLSNVSTDSPWPLSNNPYAKYNDRARQDCNLDLPLWQIVRASTAAPTFFPPEIVTLGTNTFVFVDGGMTPFNNPALQLFRMATTEPYRLNWKTGENDLLVVSIGTGNAANVQAGLGIAGRNQFANLINIPGTLMYGASIEQDLMCRMIGKCRFGATLDREIGDLTAGSGLPPLFSYVRYNPELSRAGLNELGLVNVQPSDVQSLDSIAAIDQLQEVGTRYAERVQQQHFDGFPA